jgi:hypothetical protein
MGSPRLEFNALNISKPSSSPHKKRMKLNTEMRLNEEIENLDIG